MKEKYLRIVPILPEDKVSIVKVKKIKPEDLVPKCGGKDQFTPGPGKKRRG